MKYLHAMVRVRDLDASLRFYCEGLGLRETRRMENEKGRYTLVFVAADETPHAEVELTWNWPGGPNGCCWWTAVGSSPTGRPTT